MQKQGDKTEKVQKKTKKYRLEDESRDKILKYIEKYFVKETGTEPKYGQLKFMKNLIVRNIAASTRVRLNKAAFLRFLEKEILVVDHEVIDFNNCDRNVKAFTESPYGGEILLKYQYREEFGFPPFLLLRKVQTVMEEKLLYYLRLSEEGQDRSLGNYRDTEAGILKQHAYVELLYCVALYEIFVKEYLAEISALWENTEGWFDETVLVSIISDIDKCGNNKMLQETDSFMEELNSKIQNYLANYDRLYFYVHFYNYIFRQLQNLLAMLRIIVLIEFVNYNYAHQKMRVRLSEKEKQELLKEEELTKLTEKEKNKLQAERKQKVIQMEKNILNEASFWYKNIPVWFREDKHFFMNIDRNPNFNKWYKKLNRIISEHKLLKVDSCKCEGKCSDFQRSLQAYIRCMENADVQKRSKEEEQQLWEIQGELGNPIWEVIWAMEEIADIF